MSVQLFRQIGSPITVPYAEVTPRSEEVSGIMSSGWGGNGAQIVRTYLCNFEDREQFEWQALGYPVRIPQSPVIYLSRQIPLRDPEKPWYFATRASRNAPFGKPGDRFGGIAKGLTPYGPGVEYPHARITLLFESPAYRVLDDGTLQTLFGGNEMFRYCTLPWEFGGEMLTRSVGNETWQFTEGANSGTAVNYTSNIGQWVEKNEWEIIWHQVPEIGVRDKNTKLLNTNILACRGKVNNAAWPNPAAGGVQFPAGTLRLNSVKTTDLPSPISPPILGLAAFDPAIAVDVHFMFSYFDPSPLSSGATTHGHNLMPYKDGTWALAKASAGTGGTLYATADFSKLFTIT